MENTPETTFDLLADIKRRSEYDSMVEEARIIENVDDSTKVQYVRMSAVFPAAPRDLLTVGLLTQLEDGRMVMVNQSIEHYLCPEYHGTVRLKVDLAGFIVERIKNQPNKCRLIQISDIDLKTGWILKSLTSIDLPSYIKKLNSILLKLPRQSVSKMLCHTPIPILSLQSSYHNGIGGTHSNYSSKFQKRNIIISEYGAREADNNNKDSSSSLSVVNTGKFVIAAAAYALVLLAGIKKWRNKNSIT
nr:3371_t:CDS:2 [Entrophospora candida]